ncbi:MAG: glucuronate isomerase [Puia sp.]|nr:glucuronate isomerase [Puia sp.]
MRKFLDEDFLLTGKTAQRLYHEFAKDMPVIDYHCHLPPDQIATDRVFENLTKAWLDGDHYKWRAMRANGIGEKYCTGTADDREKFSQWAATVPYTLRNPLYHWTHLELQRYFDIDEILNPASAGRIYDTCNERLQSPGYSVLGLLRKMKVELICTTDDPLDSLEWHRTIARQGSIRVLPAFRPDKAMNVEDPAVFNGYVDQLESVSGLAIGSYEEFLAALKKRHDFFAENGCTLSDHGLEHIDAETYTHRELQDVFNKIRSGRELSQPEKAVFRSAMLVELAVWDWEKGWVQQFHIGALRNNNTRAMRSLGPDTGWDSIGDFSQARSLSRFLNRLDTDDKLAKTILYNLNPADNELMASMIGNFNDGSVAGKIQYGSAWWFLDQKDGMTRQLNALSNMGLLTRFVGMLTDSRSFLSYPRHEYFRRILCNLFGEEVDQGELPSDIGRIGQVIKDICYHNARNYFGW